MTDSDSGAAAEIEITADLVRDLLREQHPDLPELAVREVAGGWDNQQWCLGDELAVRMPRTERAPELQRKECRWLPLLAPGLPLPVPRPVAWGPAGRAALDRVLSTDGRQGVAPRPGPGFSGRAART